MQSYEEIESPGVPIKAWTRGVELADNAREQLRNTASLPIVHGHVAVMPDVHWGMGATIGSVVPTLGAIVPAAVGVDIGCGMCALRTSLTARDLPDDLKPLRGTLERNVPHGRSPGRKGGGKHDKGAWWEIPKRVANQWKAHLADGFALLCERYPVLEKANHVNHLGTLGTGNHFIEVCLDESDRVWVMLHSGSRGVGNRIGSYFIELAKREMRRWFVNLPDDDLAYLPEGTEHFAHYVRAVSWAQSYATTNRELMMRAVIAAASLSEVLREPPP